MKGQGVVAYLRVSTAKQGASGLGLEAQREAVARYVNATTSRVIGEFVEVESGRCDKRLELQRAVALARLHRVPIVVAKLDRLSRSQSFLLNLLEGGVDVRFCDLPQIEGPQGRFLLQSMAAVAELEAGLISSRTKAALQAAKARGKKLGGDRGQIPTAEMRRISNEIRTQRADRRAEEVVAALRTIRGIRSFSLRKIAGQLALMGIPTATGRGKWSAGQVQRVLARSGL